MDQEKIGSFIKDIRKEKGLTQEQFAEKLGVTQKSVSRWENGKTMPDYSLLPSICEVLEINVAELLGAERISGDSITKKQASTMAQNVIFLANNKTAFRKIIGAILSAIIMLISVIGLYNYEFSVSVDSTSDLERAINEYHFADEVSADVLERQAVGKQLYVLYGENEYPGACGLACLEKGVFGNYRIISCEDSDCRWINGTKIKVGKKNYFVTYCASDLQNINAYGLLGVKEEPGQNQSIDSIDDLKLICKLDYNGSPFLTFTEIEDGVSISAYHIRYYQNDAEIQDAELETILGARCVEGTQNSGTGTAELGMFYVLEGIVVLLGIIFIRYFLIEAKVKRDE